MRVVYLASVWLHIIFAATWIGGMLFLALIVLPVLKGEPPARRTAILTRAALRFRTLGWVALGTLAVTGTINLYYRGLLSTDSLSLEFASSSYGSTLWLKVGLFLCVVLLSAFHDFRIGPRAARLLANAPDSPAAESARRQASWMGRLNLILALVIVAFAVTLVRGSLF